jgi:hypothetical protein
MADGGERARPSISSELTQLEWVLTDAIPNTKSIQTLGVQAGLKMGLVDLNGAPADQWHVVVRACEQQHDCLEMLFNSLLERLKETEWDQKLRPIIEVIRQKRTPFEVRIKGDLDAVRNGLRVVLELPDPTTGVTKLREIRSALTTLVKWFDEEDTVAVVIVGVTREEALNIREKMVSACLEVIAAVDKLLGIAQLREAPRISGDLLRESGDDVVVAVRHLDAVIDARNLLYQRGRRFLQLAAELLLADTGRADATPTVAGPSSSPGGPDDV